MDLALTFALTAPTVPMPQEGGEEAGRETRPAENRRPSRWPDERPGPGNQFPGLAVIISLLPRET